MAGVSVNARLYAPLLAFLLGALPMLASAQLKIGMTADGEGADMPARVGYANGDGVSSGQLQLGLGYAFAPHGAPKTGQWETHIGLNVADNRAFGVDTKAVLAGGRYLFGVAPALPGRHGEFPPGYIEVLTEAGNDRLTGSQFASANLTAVVLPEVLCSECAKAHDKGWFLRPMLGAYYDHTRNSDDPARATNGSVVGAWAGVNIQFASLDSPRNIFAYRNRFTYDLHASAERSKEHFRFHSIGYTRILNDPPKNQPTFSLTLERTVGADPIDVSRDRHGVTSIYVGIQM